MPWALRTPAASLFERIHIEADANSEIMQFLARQSGVPATRLRNFTIKFGGTAPQIRLVLLLCDETHRPHSVVKIGLNPSGRVTIDREADLLEKLPPGMIGCIQLTGRLKTSFSAFATAYFRGDCPEDDAGMEHLFHAWLNPDPPVPLGSLESWQKLAAKASEIDPAAWQYLNGALSEKMIRTTLYHGDFAPWNVRAVNSQNLQAFDWENGSTQGVPAWDWFHFFVQTSVLARRLSTERAAAEVEQLLHSERFQKYARVAGIEDITRPLLLAYLLYQRWVIQPREGGTMSIELFELLSAHWQIPPAAADVPFVKPEKLPDPHLRAGIRCQLKSAAAQWSNLFWEPSLTANIPFSWRTQLIRHWPVILLATFLLTGIATANYFISTHLVILPLYAIPCALLTWKIDRRWGAVAVTLAAIIGPLIQSSKDVEFRRLDVIIWNMAMRFLTLQLCVLFVAQIHKQKQRVPAKRNYSPANFMDNWAVIFASGLLFLIVAALDVFTNPHMVFLPLYLLPCMILTLALNLRVGIMTALTAAVCRALVEYSTNPNYTAAEVFGWNFIMRLAIFLLVIFLLDRIRKENILFFSRS